MSIRRSLYDRQAVDPSPVAVNDCVIPLPFVDLQRQLADCIISLSNLDDLRILIACGAKVNDAVTQGLRPIHYAVWQRYREAVNWLLVRGCDVNSVDDCGYSALHLAAERGYIEMLQILIEHGAKTEYRTQLDGDVQFPRTIMSDEPLRLAVKNRHFVAARILLEHGANPNARYFLGSELNLISPLDVKFLKLLLSFGANPDTKDRHGLNPLMKACRSPEGLEAVLCLVSYGADVNAMTDERHDFRTVLHYALCSGNGDIVAFLLKQGSKVNFPCWYQKPTPLDLAILRGDPAMVQMIIDAGANVNASSPIIGSPLHVAVSDNILNRLKILLLLLDAGANPNCVIKGEDNMPLRSVLAEYLASNTNPESDIISALLRYGTRVILKSQFRDPLGILNFMANVITDVSLFNEIVNIAESFDPPMIRRNAILSPGHKEYIFQVARTPHTLKHICRLSIRDALKKNMNLNTLSNLLLPNVLIHYLLFQF